MTSKAGSIKDQLANALGRRDEAPNVALAEKIAKAADKKAVEDLIGLMNHKTAAIRHDAIKVLYEIGDRKPELILTYHPDFIKLLHHNDNWMIWGAMSALYSISRVRPEVIVQHLVIILDAMDKGTVITRDHGIYILRNMATLKKYHNDCIELLLEQLQKAPVNQVPMYAEKTAEVISPPYIKRMEKILRLRHDVMEIPSKEKRIQKLLKSIQLPH